MRVVLESPTAGVLDTELRIGDPSATVSDLLGQLGLGDTYTGVVIDGRFYHGELGLGEIALYEGAGVTPARAAPPARDAPTPLQLRVISGLEAGRAVSVPPAGLEVGRDVACDVVLSDESVSRRHLRVVPGPGGVSATLTDLQSANGTWLEGTRLTKPADITPGAVFEAGDVAFTLAVPSPGLALDPLREAGPAGTIPFNRPPRARSLTTRAPLRAPQRPEDPAAARFSWASAIGPLILGGAMVVLLHSAVYALFMLLSPVLVVANWIEGRRHARRTASGHTREHARELTRFESALRERATQERDERRTALPDLADIVQRACAPDARLWERRTADEDFLTVSGGLGELRARPELEGHGAPGADAQRLLARHERLSLVPVPVPLGSGAVGIVGDRAKALAVARGLLCQAAVLHGPADLGVAVLAAPDRLADWDWAKWLPHCREPRSAGARRMLAGSPEAVSELSAELDVGSDQSDRALLVVLDGDALIEGRAAVGRALLRGSERVTGIVLARSLERLPAACTTVITVDAEGAEGSIRRPQAGEHAETVLIAGAQASTARACARALARFDDPELHLPGGAIPDDVALAGLLGPDAADPGRMQQRWAHRAPESGLAARFALGEDGPFEIDLVRDGPHGLIAGTTGAGKSELLRSLVAALAATHPPERINFVLIDYKGGSAFAQCAALPHTVGMVTDLDEQLGERALESLEAELRRRERVLREHASADLVAYDRLVADGRAEPLPRLLVIIDEFATLATELPDFIAALVGVAQRGRSLGVHLLLATQRPSGAVNENIRANTNLRICLRVQAPADSADVIDDPAAALIARDQPGRAYVRLGPGELIPVQVALVTGTSAAASQRPVELVAFGPEAPARPTEPAQAPAGPSDLERLVAAAQEAHAGRPVPRHPWLAPLPPRVALSALADMGGIRGLAGDRGVIVPLGLADDPRAQSQYPVGWNLNAGNLLLYGVVGSGVTTALAATAVSLADLADADLVHIYVLDFGAGELAALAQLPHVGAVIAAGEPERQRRLLRQLRSELDVRRGLAAGQRAARPRIVLLIDGYAGFAAELDAPGGEGMREALMRVWADGPELGMHIAIGSDRVGAVPTALASLAQQRLVLQLADMADYGQFGLRRHQIPRFSPGRAVDGSTGQVIQIAHPGALSDTVAAHRERAPTLRVAPTPIGVLPDHVALQDVLATIAQPGHEGALTLPFGIGDDDLAPAGFVLYPGEHALIAGPPRSGKTTALLALAACAAHLHPGLELIGVAGRRSPLAESPLLARTVSGAQELEALVAQLRDETAAKPGDEAAARLILIDDADAVQDPSRRLADALTAPGGFHVVAAGRGDGLNALGHWSSAVRRSRTGLLLMPNPQLDGALLGATLPRRPSPPRRPGCGYLVSAAGLELFQVAAAGALTGAG